MHEKEAWPLLGMGAEEHEEAVVQGRGLNATSHPAASTATTTTTTISSERAKKGSWAVAATVLLAVVAAAAVAAGLLLLLVSGAFGRCQQQRHHHHQDGAAQLPAESSSWLGSPAAAAPFELAGEVEDLRRAGVAGLARRQSTSATATATTTSASATGTVLVDFQVHQPVLTPEGATLDSGVSNGQAGEVEDSCQVVLMDHVFAYSYGEPFIGKSCVSL